jgi:hypothetical protein
MELRCPGSLSLVWVATPYLMPIPLLQEIGLLSFRQAQSLRQGPKAEIEQLMVLTGRERNNDQRTFVVAAPTGYSAKLSATNMPVHLLRHQTRPLNNSYYPKVLVTRFFRSFEAPISPLPAGSSSGDVCNMAGWLRRNCRNVAHL